jgi:hypothetical protein
MSFYEDVSDDEEEANGAPTRFSPTVETTKTLYKAYCGGIWIRNDLILTANHCAAGAAFIQKIQNMNPSERIQALASDKLEPDYRNTLETEMQYIVQSEMNGLEGKPKTLHKGRVVAISFEHDLALVKVDSLSAPLHSVAQLAQTTPHVGEDVLTVGHPGTLLFSFTRATVAGYRDHMTARVEKKGMVGPFIQVSGAIWKGNSGGGIFNKEGQLVSLVSFIAMAPNQSFGVRIDVLKNFLDQNSHKIYR